MSRWHREGDKGVVEWPAQGRPELLFAARAAAAAGRGPASVAAMATGTATATIVRLAAATIIGWTALMMTATLLALGLTAVALVAGRAVTVTHGFARVVGFAGPGRFATRFALTLGGARRFVIPSGIRADGRGGVVGEGVFAGVAILAVAAVVPRFLIFANVVAGCAVVTTLFVRFGMGRAEAVVAGEGAFLGHFLGVGIIRLGAGRRLIGIGTTLTLGALLAVRGRAVAIVFVGLAATTATTAASAAAGTATATIAATLTLVVTALGGRPGVAFAARGRVRTRALKFVFAVGGPGELFVFGVPIFLLVFIVEIFRGRRRSVGGAGAFGGGDGFGFLGEVLARGELDIAGGEAGEFGGAQQARGLAQGRGAEDEGGDDVAGAGAEEVFDGVGDEFRVDGALRVEGEGGFGRGLGIGAREEGGGADAVAAEFVEEGVGKVVEAAFDGGGDGAAGRGAVAIPAEDEEVALLFAQPREGDPREGEGCKKADVDPLGEVGDGGVEEGRRRDARGVNDEADVPFARHDVLSHLGQGSRVGEVAGKGDKIVVWEGVAGELGGECIHSAAHADEAPANGEARPGVGAGD